MDKILNKLAKFTLPYKKEKIDNDKAIIMSTTNEMMVKAYTTKELAAMYGISPKTFRTWTQKHKENIGEKAGRYYTALQVRIIFEKLGIPG